MNGFDTTELRLLNDYQHEFPLVRRPFRKIGEHLGISESEVIDRLSHLSDCGAISRVGPVFSPGCIGVSTLAALSVPKEQLETVATWLNAFPEINHNYERDHEYNLWFVATAPNQTRLDQVLEQISEHVDCPMLTLPLEERFHIDLGFDLNGSRCRRHAGGSNIHIDLNGAQSAIVAALQGGIRLEKEPFAALGAQVRMTEDYVLDQIAGWRKQGVIKRFGVVVRHHELGYRENAMVVWNVPDDRVGEFGKLAAQHACVTLCYRRPRRLPDWPYNLFCMVHGTDRNVVEKQVAELAQATGLEAFDTRVLFSLRRFKQHGARYVNEAAHG
jgi:DNA-binding Lrp family transcriptional regulator